MRDATENNAPAEVLSDIARLPSDDSFENVQQIWEQLSGGKEERF